MYCIVLCRCTYICTYISIYVCMYSIRRCIVYNIIMFMYIHTYVRMCICAYIQYNSLSNISPVSTWVSIYILLVDTHTPHSVDRSCTPCQLVLVVSASDSYSTHWCGGDTPRIQYTLVWWEHSSYITLCEHYYSVLYLVIWSSYLSLSIQNPTHLPMASISLRYLSFLQNRSNLTPHVCGLCSCMTFRYLCIRHF